MEIKAWVRRPGITLALIDRLCVFRKEYLKEDVYFRTPEMDIGRRDLRVRRENETWICTRKEKTIRDGLEVNDEREFTLSDGPSLMELLEGLGCREFFRKTKKGRSYSYGDLTVEVSEVAGLGLFVEVEKVADSASPEEIARTEEEIRRFLAEAGVLPEDIESRSYAVMLRD